MSANPPSRKRLALLLVVLAIAGALVMTDERAPEVVGAVARPPVAATATASGTPSGQSVAASPATPVATSANGGSTLALRGSAELSPTIDASMIMAINERRRGRAAADPFAVRSWNPPPVAAKPLPPPAPVPPAFTFTVLGKQFIDGRWEVFLGQRERTLIVKEGDAIDGAFKVLRIAPPTMTLEVLRFAARQPVPIGAPD